ncbi:MAG: alanine/ornithine racemase family PLP-dependent enzyme [Oscillospiraceae bacterium]|nr:alanine/ornithine racemase family PLP-dependent enzyme [Oscillospiraceae bacterium]
MERQFPRLSVSLPKLRRNASEIVTRCAAKGIDVCGVIKGCTGIPQVARAFLDAGVKQLGSSRLEQIVRCRQAGVPGPYLLLRIPGLSELPEVVRWCDISLQSELTTLDALEAECARQNKNHRVIVMVDLGDIREGYWDQDEMVAVCAHAERDLTHLELAGIGVNLGCVGSVQPTPEKMNDLLALRDRVEKAIGRKLDIVSGGATSSFTLVHWNTMPEGINHLRIGENILLGKDLQLEWGIEDMNYLAMDTFTLTAEVIEVKTKPSYPQGQLCIDAFGHKPTYVDYGIQRRAILALGKADVGDEKALLPRDPGLTVWGASSDHCILDVTHCGREIKVGDTVDFSLAYSNLVYVTAREDVNVVCIEEGEVNS